MSILKLTQTTSDGRTKMWKFNSSTEVLTFGSSRKAHITSIDTNVEKFDSVIEYRNSEWHYITFSMVNENSDKKIKHGDIIKLKNCDLKFELINKNLNLLDNFKAIESKGNSEHLLLLVLKNDAIINLYIKDLSKSFNLALNGKNEKIKLEAIDTWSYKELHDYKLKYKKIKGSDITLFTKNYQNTTVDTESKLTVIATLAITCILIAASLFAPHNPTDKATLQPQNSNTMVLKNEFKKKISKIKQQTSKGQKQEIVQNNNSQPNGGSKISALLKNSIGVRISQLIGKVSATEARSANLLVTKSGIKADQGPSGRALSSVGKIESSGRNWNGESVGSKSGVSTAGIGGGNGNNGLGGGLAQGKTGGGGVGLLEDESEIVGGLDREVIAEYIKTQLGQILYCYERQLSANPSLYGKIAVKFTISGTGLVETQSINDTTLKNVSVESCILSKISKWKFPQPKGGTKVLVTYPFLFKSVI